jgi:hypothetical protein
MDEDAPTTTFSILLRAHGGEPMPGARCRVIVNDTVVNEDAPYADGEGRIELELGHEPVTARVEWAPGDTPLRPFYPYRKTYFVDLREDSREEAARRRLHNLGYSNYYDMTENIKDYQRNNGYRRATGLLDHIEDELIAYHDQGVEPEPAPPDADEDGADEGGAT